MFFRITIVVIVPGETVTLKMQNSLMREETSDMNTPCLVDVKYKL